MLLSILFFAISKYLVSISTPIPFLFSIVLATNVVPEPKKGSRIVSPTKLNSLIHLFGNSNGNGAGCRSLASPGILHLQSLYVMGYPLWVTRFYADASTG